MMTEKTDLSPRLQARANRLRRAGLFVIVALIAWTIGATVFGVVTGLRDGNVQEPPPLSPFSATVEP